MKYFRKLRQNDDLQEALYEIPAGFLFVLFYFLVIEHALQGNSGIELILRPLIFMASYFLIYLLFSARATVHILPVISFIESLTKENFSDFLYRLPGQLFGALLATIIHFAGIKFGRDADFAAQFTPLHPFFTGLFTGFMAQIIYFLYYFLIVNFKAGLTIRYLLFSSGLGAVFFIVSLINGISLLNPFGIFFHYFMSGNTVNAEMVLISGTVHVLVPMFFIAGTHYFLKLLLIYIRK